ncbi:MAG: hypothetical protein DLM63_02160 [Solirubrobacterales bacterium]|nr:MAG: hypothetical protein DLM63_02160 [Solirubrobacterales bacterium]
MDLLARALRYPFPAPDRSISLRDGLQTPLDPSRARWQGRRAILAYGANAAPEALALKLGLDAHLDLLRGTLHGFDVVYSAHLSAYGAIPSTLRRSSGTSIAAYVLLLSDDQLARLHTTEPNYKFVALSGLEITIHGLEHDAGPQLRLDGAYVSRHGSLAVAGRELAVQAIPARQRRLPAAGERDALKLARDRLAPGIGLAEFVAIAVSDAEQRDQWTAALRRDAIAAP